MKNLEQKAREYRLPTKTTAESLEEHWSTVINFGNKVLLAGYLYQGKNQPSYFAAVYTATKDAYKGKAMPTFHCDDEIKLTAVSDEFFADNGHAIAWAMQH